MSSLSDRVVPKGRVVRGRTADVQRGVQRSTTPLTAVGGLELEGPIAAHIEEQAREAGYAAGYAEGLHAAERQAVVHEAQRAQELETVRRCFGDAQRAYEQALAAALTDLEDALATAAMMLAEAVIGRELALSENPGRDAIARALALAPHQLPVTARCHPDDIALLGDVRSLFGDRDISVVADPTVESGGCILRVGRTEIDAQLSTAVERARKALCG